MGVVARGGVEPPTFRFSVRYITAGQIAEGVCAAFVRPGHDRGQVLVDVSVMLAEGGEAIANINV